MIKRRKKKTVERKVGHKFRQQGSHLQDPDRVWKKQERNIYGQSDQPNPSENYSTVAPNERDS